ncbi:DctP family TRAP transporter solute-binding subunit [Brevibacillus ginsengisoli]|uniref:DctP family TRAP transporter solute-binding subunit n=1 Tax=Brevibacillus ginsengisoli TaxID=363854 RepID=UPI003CEE3045
MRSIIGISIIIIGILITAVVIGFRSELGSNNLSYDDEQKGLNQRIIIKFSHVVAENTPKGLAVDQFANLVSEKTNGKVEVQVYPNGILYSDKDEFQALWQGNIQMIAPAYSKISTLYPSWMVLDLPFAFPNQQAVDESLHGEIGQILFHTLESKNMKGLAFWSNGFKQVTSNQHPILTPKDFREQKIRIMPSKVLEDQYRLLGAQPVPIPFNEVYQNIENGTVDGQENTISNIFTKRLYLGQKYLTLSNHGYLGYAVIVNKSFWDKLPSDIQDKIQEALQETSVWNNQKAVSMNEKQLNELRTMSVLQIHELTNEQRNQWIQATDPLYNKYADTIGYGLVNKVKQIRNKYAYPQPR